MGLLIYKSVLFLTFLIILFIFCYCFLLIFRPLGAVTNTFPSFWDSKWILILILILLKPSFDDMPAKLVRNSRLYVHIKMVDCGALISSVDRAGLSCTEALSLLQRPWVWVLAWGPLLRVTPPLSCHLWSCPKRKKYCRLLRWFENVLIGFFIIRDIQAPHSIMFMFITYLPCDFLLRVSASSWSLQRKGKGLLLQWLVLLPELPSGQLLPNTSTTAAQLGHQQAQGGEAHPTTI